MESVKTPINEHFFNYLMKRRQQETQKLNLLLVECMARALEWIKMNLKLLTGFSDRQLKAI